MINPWRSLSARLLLIFAATALVFVYGTRVAVNLVLDTDYLRALAGSHVSHYLEYILEDIGDPPSMERAQEITEAIPVDLRIIGPNISWASDPSFPAREELDFVAPEFAEADARSVWGGNIRLSGYYRRGNHRFTLLDLNDEHQVILVSPKLAETLPEANTYPIILTLALLLLAVCYWAVRQQIRPIQSLREEAARVGRGELDHRVKVNRSDELGDLGRDINRMADDVSDMLEAKRQMLLAISHELRSPLTRCKVSLEFIDDRRVRDDIASDIGEMEQLIADLLETERLNDRHRVLNLDTVEVGELLKAMTAEFFAADLDRLELRLPDRPLECVWDGTRIKLAVKNLVENALRHSGAEETVVLAARAGTDGVEIEVADRGEGISSADLSRITQPFYRADPARQRSTGGFGLGLYLARLVAEAHGGALAISSQPGEGTRATLSIPRVVEGS